MRTIQQSDVVNLNRSTGELVFRFMVDDPVAEQQAVEYEGVGYIVTHVGALAFEGGCLGAKAKVVDLVDLGARPFALTLKQGDVVVLQADHRMTGEQLREIKGRASEAFVGFPVVVLDAGVKIGKVTK